MPGGLGVLERGPGVQLVVDVPFGREEQADRLGGGSVPGLDRHRLAAASPPDPPPHPDRRAGLSLLLRPRGPASGMTRLIRAAGLRWPVEEECRVRLGRLRPGPVTGPPLYRDHPAHCPGHGRPGHLRCHRCPAQGPHGYPGAATGASRPGTAGRPGHDPLTVPEVRRLTAAATARPWPPGHLEHWSGWTRAHQARSRWFHQRTRLERDQEITMNDLFI